MNKYKLFAPFLSLFAGAICLILMLVWGYKLSSIVWILLAVVLGFYIAGALIQKRVHKFVEANEAREREEAEKEGTVIEKESGNSEDSETEGSLPPLTGAGAFGIDNEQATEGSNFRTRPGSSDSGNNQ